MRDLVLHCLAIKLLIWIVVAAAASVCFCRELIVALILICLWVRSFHTRCGSALFTPAVGRLFSHPLWVGSFHTRCGSALFTPAPVGPFFSHPLWVRSFLFFFSLVLFEAAGISRCTRLSVAPCTTFPTGELFACVQHAHSRVPRGLLD